MTMTDMVMAVLVTGGFFVSATVARWFRQPTVGILIGGVAGLAVSVLILRFGLTELYAQTSLPVPE